MTRSASADLALYRRMLLYARPYWGHVFAYFLLSLFSAPLALLGPLPLKLAVDSVIGDEPLPRFLAAALPHDASGTTVLAFAAGLLIAIALATQLQKLAASLVYTYTGEKLALAFRARVFRHVQNLSLMRHDRKGTADSTYRVLWDSPAIRHIALDGVTPFLTAGITLASMVYVIVRIDWQLALVALAVSPMLFVLMRVYRSRLRAQWRSVKELESGALSVVQEVLSGIRIVKAFGQEEREQARFVRESTAGMTARIRATLAIESLGLLVATTTVVGTAAVLYIGVRHVQAGTLTLGDLLIVMAYLAALYAPLQTMSKNVGSLQAHLASAERVVSLLDEPPDVEEDPHAVRLRRASGAIECRDVGFAFEPGRPVLRGISFTLAPGTRVAVAGETGAGKTTLMSLLPRFYDPTCGQILLDGVDLRHYRVADLREQFSIVPQDTLLFSTSIAENIAYARPEASQGEIVEAARAANAHEFILGLSSGYDTLVGERGVRLSGGERQRIALARAFLKDAPILILDEPTSAIDLKTEAGILDALERLMVGRTTFLTTHRVGTLSSCDVLLLVHEGELVTVTTDVTAAIENLLKAGPRAAAARGRTVDV